MPSAPKERERVKENKEQRLEMMRYNPYKLLPIYYQQYYYQCCNKKEKKKATKKRERTRKRLI